MCCVRLPEARKGGGGEGGGYTWPAKSSRCQLVK